MKSLVKKTITLVTLLILLSALNNNTLVDENQLQTVVKTIDFTLKDGRAKLTLKRDGQVLEVFNHEVDNILAKANSFINSSNMRLVIVAYILYLVLAITRRTLKLFKLKEASFRRPVLIPAKRYIPKHAVPSRMRLNGEPLLSLQVSEKRGGKLNS